MKIYTKRTKVLKEVYENVLKSPLSVLMAQVQAITIQGR